MEFSIVTASGFVIVLDEAAKIVAKSFGKDITRMIPVLSLIFGVILGILGYYEPSVNFGSNLIEAIFIGLSAGGASTGYHQIYKQLTKFETSDAGSNTENESTEDDGGA